MQPTTAQDPAPVSADAPARKRKTFRDRWASLTHHKSSNPDSPAGNTDTPLHQQAYQPKHAGRDALLAIPLAERKKGDGTKLKAVKSHSLEDMEMAVHPNRNLSSNSLSSWARDKDGRPVSWGLWSSPGGSMERIPEDGVVASPGGGMHGDGATCVTSQRGSFETALEKPAPARMSKRYSTTDLDGMGEASGTITPTDPSGSGSNSNSNSDTNTSSSLSSTELYLRARKPQQEATSALIMRQLQDRVSPPPTAKGVGRRPTAIRTKTHPSPLGAEGRKGRKEYFGHGAVGRPSFNGMMAQTTAENADPAGESISQGQQHHGVTWKGKGKARARFEETDDQKSADKERSAVSTPAAPNFGWPRPSIPGPAAETPISGNSNNTVAAPGPILPLRQEDAEDVTGRERSPSPLQLSSAERTQSAETVNSPTSTAFTSDVSRNESNASSATTADDAGDWVEGEGEKEAGEDGEYGKTETEAEEEDWGQRVLAAAQAL